MGMRYDIIWIWKEEKTEVLRMEMIPEKKDVDDYDYNVNGIRCDEVIVQFLLKVPGHFFLAYTCLILINGMGYVIPIIMSWITLWQYGIYPSFSFYSFSLLLPMQPALALVQLITENPWETG